MSELERLIAELCPDGVEYRTLGEIAVRTKGTPVTATQMRMLDKPNAPVKIFAGGKTVAYFDYADLPEKDINTFPSVIVKSRGTIEFEYYDKPFSHKNEMWSYHSKKEDVNIKYLYYYLRTQERKLCEKATSMGAFPQISIPDTEQIAIPFPPYLIQREIVRILDNFTELTAKLTTELTAELSARKKQYEYYRNELLTFGDDVPILTLGELALKAYSGGTPLANKTEYYDGDIPWLRTQEVRFVDIYDTEMRITPAAIENSAAKWIPANCVIIAISGATAGRSAINKIPLTTNQHCCCLEINPRKALYRYVFHWVSCQYEKIKSLGQGARSDLNSSIIKNYPISLPSLKEQTRIVEILDHFDTITTNITTGLPAEIEARRKQYEYYRDKLLTFKEKLT
ncbi:MAG: restriction endonuclease subunit S [Clostridiales bacterium]|jgi:type I restriction enzyme S subunit|nr:restriction endonuclease subunit S [Clostridiales bacterium]